MRINNTSFKVFDNGGETTDRYTILFTISNDCVDMGDMYGASENPFSGYGEYVGNCVNSYYLTTFGSGWRKGHSTKQLFNMGKDAMRHWVSDRKYDKKETEIKNLKDLPDGVKKYIEHLTTKIIQ